MTGGICFALGLLWLAAQLVLAYPLLVWLGPGVGRQLWFASAVALLPLLRNLGKFAVAAPTHASKIPSVEREILRRMGLTLALAGVLAFLADAGLGAAFWVGLALFYQVSLALDVGLLLHQWNAARTPEQAVSAPPG